MLSHHKAAVIHGASFSSSPIKKKKKYTPQEGWTKIAPGWIVLTIQLLHSQDKFW